MAETERKAIQRQLHALQQQQGQRSEYERALEAWQQKKEATQASIADSQVTTQAMKHELKECQVRVIAPAFASTCRACKRDTLAPLNIRALFLGVQVHGRWLCSSQNSENTV
jgi:type IV secretory pathway VirJ component